MEQTIDVALLLGGKKILKRNISSAFDMLEAVRSGLPYSSLEAIQRLLDVQVRLLSSLIGVPPRTLSRRKKANQLSASESDRLYRIAYIVSMAKSVFGSLDKARTWLRQDNRALGGTAPIDLLDTAIGVRQVEEILHRINYGIYS